MDLTNYVRTVLGDIEPTCVGVTLPHEHTMFGWNGAEFDHRALFNFDEVVNSVVNQFLIAKKEFNLATFVDCTAPDMGRQPQVMEAVSKKSGINIVAATGFFCQSMGIPYHWRRQSIEEIAAFFVKDVKQGIFNTGIKCGIIKVSSGQDDVKFCQTEEVINGRHIGEFEQKIFAAAASAQKYTGVPITTHIDPEDWKIPKCNIGLEQLELLLENGGISEKIIIGHTFFASEQQLLDILSQGCYVQCDNIGTNWRGLDDDYAINLILKAIEKGYEDKLLISFDTFWSVMRGERDYTEQDPAIATRMPIDFLNKNYFPKMLQKGISEEVIQKITCENPIKLLTFST